jgi:hypothetical protein
LKGVSNHRAAQLRLNCEQGRCTECARCPGEHLFLEAFDIQLDQRRRCGIGNIIEASNWHYLHRLVVRSRYPVHGVQSHRESNFSVSSPEGRFSNASQPIQMVYGDIPAQHSGRIRIRLKRDRARFANSRREYGVASNVCANIQK